MLEQARGRLSAGVTAATTVGEPTVDLTISDAPLVLVYDSDHNLMVSTATIAGPAPNCRPGGARRRGGSALRTLSKEP